MSLPSVEAETAYRHEQINASFRDHAAVSHRVRFRRSRGSADTVVASRQESLA
jgi:hypothetical protein